jgi:Fe/S biogenesis protein NfuA
VTLSEGIKRMILEAIPEVVDVVDATDHAAGESPFYS